MCRGRILGRDPNKSLKSFPPCYSQSALQLRLEIFISSNSRNLLQFLQSVPVLCKGERRKTWWKTIPPSLRYKKSIQRSQLWELSRLCPETSTKLYVHEIGFSTWMLLFLMHRSKAAKDSGDLQCKKHGREQTAQAFWPLKSLLSEGAAAGHAIHGAEPNWWVILSYIWVNLTYN